MDAQTYYHQPTHSIYSRMVFPNRTGNGEEVRFLISQWDLFPGLLEMPSPARRPTRPLGFVLSRRGQGLLGETPPVFFWCCAFADFMHVLVEDLSGVGLRFGF